jgi:hypothetical protein
MRLISFHSLLYASLTITVVFTPALSGQTAPTCNGRAATIVASTPGAIYGTNGDDVIIGRG